jgi:hypothetical protein
MAQPVWITPAGNLGTIPEGIFYELALTADVAPIGNVQCTATSSSSNRVTCNSTNGLYPGLEVYFSGTTFGGVNTFTRYFVQSVVNSTQITLSLDENGTVSVALTTASGSMLATFNQHPQFVLQAGSLPSGVQITDNGLIEGIPKAVANIQGVPTEVSADVTSKFTVRAYTETQSGAIDRINDRTFTLTVAGQDTPEWITPAGQIAQEYDGGPITPIQIEYTDSDPSDNIVVSLKAGTLPTGLTISNTGLISGFIAPFVPINGLPGYDATPYDQFPFDFPTQSIDINYEFVLELSDGKSSNLRTFSIFVYSRDSLTADNTEITADNTFVTADVSPVRVPFIISPTPGSIGRIRNDNFFAVQFVGLDLDGDPIEYELGYDIGDSTTIPGLTLDPGTGWLYGYIPSTGLTENTYDFYIRAYKKNDPAIISNDYNYSLTIVGPVDTDISWITDSDLGIINNGATSTLYVLATNVADIPLQYQLDSGSNSSLPQGLQLLPSGEIAGRVSFDTFALDLGLTTFDVTLNDLAITGENTETTFDMSHTFTVNAYSTNGLISVFKTFTITVNREYNEPYENLYIQAMPPQRDRDFIDSLLQNQDIFQPDLLYRPADPNFGRATNVVYDHAFGLTAATIEDYYSSLYENHYWKNLTLGEIQVAQAVDATGEVIYEVVYSAIQDNLLNNQGLSVSKEVTLPYTVTNQVGQEISVVYPNSLINMRDQVIDTVGQVGSILPLWMTSKQANGRVLGFTPAWVLSYVKPGRGEQIAYYVRTKFGERLNLIDFEVDRYELDRLLTKNWDPKTTVLNINNITGNGNTVTVTYSVQSIEPAEPGTNIAIAGVNPSAYNGSYVVETCTTTQLTFVSNIDNTYVSGGTLTIPAQWEPTPAETTFDLVNHYQLPEPNDSSFAFVGGTGYAVGDRILILGSQVGGVDGDNNITIIVTEIDNNGTIEQARASGFAPLFSTGDVYTNVVGTNIVGTNAEFTIRKNAQV